MTTSVARLLMAWLALGVVSTAHAHEIGTTQVVARFQPDGTYQIDIVVDPEALLARLQILDGSRAATPEGRDERNGQIDRLAPVFADAVSLRFDGRAVRPRVEYRPVSAFSDFAQTPSVVRLSGGVPSAARTFTFSYGLATGTFGLVVHVGESAAQTFWLEGGRESGPVSLVAPPLAPTSAAVATRYFELGFLHILPKGLDHILFVAGLFLLSTKWRSVLLQVSAFTVAHSITLGLTMYGVVSLPARVVEPMIALSIVYVAIENVLTTDLKSWRVALVFSFGLLHGMGFAGVLRELGLPRGDFLTALLAFNLGVEAGQLAVVAVAFALVAHWRSNTEWYHRCVVQPASTAIALMGAYWTVQRLL